MYYDISRLRGTGYFKHIHVYIMEKICAWIVSKEHPYSKTFDGSDLVYYWIKIKKLAEDCCLSYQQVKQALWRLENKDKRVEYAAEPILYSILDHTENKLFISMNIPEMKKILGTETPIQLKSREVNMPTLQKRIGGNTIYTKGIGKMKKDALFDAEKPSYSMEADMIARLILKKYPQYFSHRIPDENSSPTKTYVNICRCIDDLYNGRFIRERVLSEGFLNGSQFNLDGWQKKIKDVKGDWVAVKKLILGALKNFALMHDEDRMPYSKQYLQTNLSLWFYDSVTSKGDGKSQFIACLSEPEFTKKHNSEVKADRIFETLSNKARIGGNELFEMNTSMPSGMFWDNVRKMVEWGQEALSLEENIHYWISSASELPHLFAEYCKGANISVSLSTVDIERAVECGSPWTWFVKDACLKHGLNPKLAECGSPNRMAELYHWKIPSSCEDLVF